MNKTQKVGFFLGPISFAAIMLLAQEGNGLTDLGIKVLASVMWMIIWWTTQPVPLGVTSLIPILLFPLLGMDPKETGINVLNNYVHPVVMLSIPVFWLSAAIESTNLHRRIAFSILKLFGTKSTSMIMGFGIVTSLLSMWMSNTTATAMMIPIILALIDSFNEIDKDFGKRMGTALILIVAFCAGIGGIGTPIGTGTNMAGIGMIKEITGSDITFLDWMIFAVPLVVVLTPVVVFLLKYSLKLSEIKVEIDKALIDAELNQLGKFSADEKIVAISFGLCMVAWITRTFWKDVLPLVDDYVVAGLGCAILFIWPSVINKGKSVLTLSKAVESTSWGTVFLLGGSMLIGSAFSSSGLTEWIASFMMGLANLPEIGVLILLSIIVSILTEFSTNMVVAIIFIPVAAAIADTIGTNPMPLMLSVTISASFGFMLPQSTPPMALVYGSEIADLKDIMKSGLIVKIVSILLFPVLLYAIKALGLIKFM